MKNNKEFNKEMAISLLKGDMAMTIMLIAIAIGSYIVGGMYTLIMLSIVWFPLVTGFMCQTIKSWRLYMDYKHHDFKDRADW